MKKLLLFALFSHFLCGYALTDEEYCIQSSQNECVTPFGSKLGENGNVPAFSNCRSECIRLTENTVHVNEINLKKDIISGLTWQCVEYARRWWILERGIRFDSVFSADQIFSLREAIRLKDNKKIPLKQHLNSSLTPPATGDLLIYAKSGKDDDFPYGHVAVIVHVNLKKGFVDIAEQNYENKVWEEPHLYSRRIKLEFKQKKYTIYDISHSDFNPHTNNKKEKNIILGWVSASL